MANTIALAETYLPLLDEVYKAESKTSVLDTANGQIRFVGGNKIELFNITMDALGNYSRATGFPNGNVTASWEPMVLSVDRGRSFSVDAMDNEETMGMAFGTLAGEFLRTQVVPEVDTFRFAKYAGLAPTEQVKAIGSGTLGALIDDAEMALTNAEVPEEGKMLFLSADGYKLLKGGINRDIKNMESMIDHAIGVYDTMPVIVVPQNRMKTLCNLTADGYNTTGATDILAMIVHPTAVAQVTKHEVPRIFDPATTQAADSWKFDYRIYHDTFALANKKNGIYVITK